MKVSELKAILNNVPDDFDIKAITYFGFGYTIYDVQGIDSVGYSSNEILMNLDKGE